MYLRYFEVIVIAIIQNYKHGWIHYANEHLYFEINKKIFNNTCAYLREKVSIFK
jgi:hypothetical protein